MLAFTHSSNVCLALRPGSYSHADLDIQAVAVVPSADKHTGRLGLRAEGVHMLHCIPIAVSDALVVVPPTPQHQQQCTLCPVADKLHALDMRHCCVVAAIDKESLHQGDQSMLDDCASVSGLCFADCLSFKSDSCVVQVSVDSASTAVSLSCTTLAA